MKKNIIKATIIVLSLVISAALISGSYVYHSNKENNEMQIAKQESIAEHGVIAEIYYDSFIFPENKTNVKNIMDINKFELKEEYNDSRNIYDSYEKKVNIEDKDYTLTVTINYRDYESGDEEQNIYYEITYKEKDDLFKISEQYFIDKYWLDFDLNKGDDISMYIDLLTGETILEPDEELYQNYLNGDYDAQITEMETIMEEELQPLPKDYVAPNTTK